VLLLLLSNDNPTHVRVKIQFLCGVGLPDKRKSAIYPLKRKFFRFIYFTIYIEQEDADFGQSSHELVMCWNNRLLLSKEGLVM
jgi:hypothetical protein